jgi:GAF domain-containing protein
MNPHCILSEKIRVLLIDDEISLLGPMKVYLQDFGYEVDTARNGAEAFELIHKNSGFYDVALIDYSLIPGPNGIEIMKQIKSIHPHIECIMITGWGLENRHQALREGAFRYIEKNEDKQELALHTRAAAQQVRLRMLGQTMLAEHNLDNLLKAIVASSLALVFADDAAIIIEDKYSKELKLFHLESSQFVHPLITLNPIVWHDIFSRQEIVSIPDLITTSTFDEQLASAEHRSFIGLPIPGENKIIGVLYLFSHQPHHFDEYSNTAVLQTMTSYAAMAVLNAWADNELKQHSKHMEALVSVSQRLAGCSNLEAQYNLAWEFVRDQLDISTFIIAMHQPENDVLTFPIGYDEDQPLLIETRSLNAHENWGVSGFVIKTGQEVLWQNNEEELSYCEQNRIIPFVHGKKCQCCFYLPIVIDHQVTGVISVQSNKADAFPDFLLDACRALGNQLAAAMQNTRLYTAQEQRANEADTLRKTTLALSASIELNSIFGTILTELKKVVPYDTASVQLLRENRQGKYFEIITGNDFPDLDSIIGQRFPIDGPYPNSEVYQQNKPVIVSNVREKYKIFCTPPHDGVPINEWLGIPMLVGERLIGLIALDKQQTSYYTQYHCQLAEAFAAQASAAVDNACHHEETERANRLLKSLEEYTRHIRADKEPLKLFHETARLATQLLQWSVGATFVYSPHLGELELEIVYQLPEKLQGSRISDQQGLIGLAARSGDIQYIPSVTNNLVIEELFEKLSIKSAIVVPLKYAGIVDRILLIGDYKEIDITETDIEILERFAAQASIALQTSRLFDKEQHQVKQLYILRKISEAIEARKDISIILHIIMTGITAGYGLGFNRAVLLRIQGDSIIGLKAIGHQDAVTARCDWEESHKKKLDEFDKFLLALEEGYIESTPLGDLFDNKSLSLSVQEREIVLKQLEENRVLRVTPRTLAEFPTFSDLFKPTTDSLIAPIRSANQVIGLVIVDNKFTQTPITSQDEEALLTFAKTVAVALENHQAFNELRRSQERLQKTRLAACEVAKVTAQGILQNTLISIREAAREVLGCSLFTLYVYDSSKNCFTDFEHYGTNGEGIIREPENIKPTSTAWTILRLSIPYYYYSNNSSTDPVFKGDFVEKEKVKATLGVKLTYQKKPVGVIFLNYREEHVFEDEELETTLMFAELAASAIQNAQYFDLVNRQKRYLQVLFEAGNLITSSLSAHDRLIRIAEQARKLTGASGPPALFCDVLLIEDGHLNFKVTIPEEYRPTYTLYDINSHPIGVIGRAYLKRKSQVVSNTKQDIDYRVSSVRTLSEVAVPMKDQDGNVIGVINIESTEPNAFDKEDKTQLEFLAIQAAIAISNVKVYEELRISKGIIGGRTALAWMGMANTFWRHSIEKDVNTIQGEIELLKHKIKHSQYDRLDDHLTKIERKAAAVQAKPFVPPLSSEEGIDAILLNQLISQRTEQRTLSKYAVLNQSYSLPDHYVCYASREWLRRAFDVIVDNAIQAISYSEHKEITIGTRLLNTKTAEIFIADTGAGIPEEIRARIGMEKIEKPEDAVGLGMGLLMAQTILAAFGGSISVNKTGPSGTEIALKIPTCEYNIRER